MSNAPSRSRAAGSSSQPARIGRGSHDTPTGSSNPSPRDDQRTVISDKPPIPAEPMSDSVARIIQGKILQGDRLGHFELVEYIGGGGMGRVFSAIDKRLGRTVALKVLAPEHACDKDTVQRFKNEAQAAARMDHPNIARVHYVGEDRDLHFIAFEFIEGINVRDLVGNNGPLPLAEAISYTLQIAEALAHSDERNIVHRDVKPSNVLITPEGRVKLIDILIALPAISALLRQSSHVILI
jgi:serine/threonine protein kinase